MIIVNDYLYEKYINIILFYQKTIQVKDEIILNLKENYFNLKETFDNLLKEKIEFQNECEKLNNINYKLNFANEENSKRYMKNFKLIESTMTERFHDILNQANEKYNELNKQYNILNNQYNSLMEDFENLKAFKVSIRLIYFLQYNS